MTDEKHVAVYFRGCRCNQDHEYQFQTLKWWMERVRKVPSRMYVDGSAESGMDRPGWAKLEADLEAGKVRMIAVWRLDHLGRTASGLTALFERLRAADVGFVSLKESLNLSTPQGRKMADAIASVAFYEKEVRSERVRAGQAIARAKGKKWGGRKPGTRIKVSEAKERTIRNMKAEGEPIARIARTVEVSRQTVYRVLARQDSTEIDRSNPSSDRGASE